MIQLPVKKSNAYFYILMGYINGVIRWDEVKKRKNNESETP